MATTKRQLSFYAEADVDLYLSYLEPGSKTAILNSAIKNRMCTDAIVDLNDGKRPVYFAGLSEADMSEVHSNLILEELALNDVDDHLWTIVRETKTNSWKNNTQRYLALHHAKFKEPFRIKRLRSQEERDEFKQNRPAARYYCSEHASENAEVLSLADIGELRCAKCGELANCREYK